MRMMHTGAGDEAAETCSSESFSSSSATSGSPPNSLSRSNSISQHRGSLSQDRAPQLRRISKPLRRGKSSPQVNLHTADKKKFSLPAAAAPAGSFSGGAGRLNLRERIRRFTSPSSTRRTSRSSSDAAAPHAKSDGGGSGRGSGRESSPLSLTSRVANALIRPITRRGSSSPSLRVTGIEDRPQKSGREVDDDASGRRLRKITKERRDSSSSRGVPKGEKERTNVRGNQDPLRSGPSAHRARADPISKSCEDEDDDDDDDVEEKRRDELSDAASEFFCASDKKTTIGDDCQLGKVGLKGMLGIEGKGKERLRCFYFAANLCRRVSVVIEFPLSDRRMLGLNLRALIGKVHAEYPRNSIAPQLLVDFSFAFGNKKKKNSLLRFSRDCLDIGVGNFPCDVFLGISNKQQIKGYLPR